MSNFNSYTQFPFYLNSILIYYYLLEFVSDIQLGEQIYVLRGYYFFLVGVHYPALTNIIAKRVPLNERTFITSLVFASGPLG